MENELNYKFGILLDKRGSEQLQLVSVWLQIQLGHGVANV